MIKIIRNPVVTFMCVIALISCNPSSKANKKAPSADNAHNSKNSLDWKGTYHGILPCADCESIYTELVLNTDLTYILRTKYAGKGDSVYESSGKLTWNDQGNTITLSSSTPNEQPGSYFVGENTLTQLDRSGNRITGELAGKYVLKKADQSITEKYWKLVELNGKAIGDKTFNKKPHLIFKAADNRVIGHGGCNSFAGTYELKEPNRITISNVAATKMACMNYMDIESQLFNVLASADNFNVTGDMLILNKAKMAPLARFEAVYLK